MKEKINSSTLYRYIVINLIILLVPFLAVVFIWMKSQYSKEIQNYMELERSALSQTRGQTEEVLNDLKRVAYQISFNRKMTAHELMKGNYDSVAAIQQLNYYLSDMNGYGDLVVSFGNNEGVYRIKGKLDFDVLTSATYKMNGTLEKERLYQLMNGGRLYGFLTADEYLYRGGQHYTLITYPIYSGDQQVYATLSGIISREELEKCLVEQKLSSQTWICNKAGEILFTNAQQQKCIAKPLQELLQSTDGFFEYKEGKEKYLGVAVFSEETQMYYIRVVSRNTLFHWQLQEMGPTVLILMLVGILVMLVLAAILSFYNYLPIRNLLRMFDKDVDYREKHDELLMLNEYILDLQEKNKSLSQMIEDREREQIQSILIDILFGRYQVEEEDIIKLQQHEISIENAEFAIVTLACQMEDQLQNKILTERLRALPMKYLFWIAQEPANCFIFLYHAPEGTKCIEQQAKVLKDYLIQQNYNFSIGVGGYTDAIDKLQGSLTEGILSMNREMDRLINVYDRDGDYGRRLQKVSVYPEKEELFLQLSIQKGDREQILGALDNIEKELGNLLHYHQGDEIRFKLYRIIGYLSELPGTSEKAVDKYVEKLIHYRDIAGFFADFRECIEHSVNIESKNREIKGISSQKILDFIDENYLSPEMSLAYVADYFSIRASYLSTFFKETIGVNFITYIQEKRMEQARRLLIDTDLTIQQIAVGVGYSDVPPFTKKFSGKFGMPPGAYRKIARGGESNAEEERKDANETSEGSSGKQE